MFHGSRSFIVFCLAAISGLAFLGFWQLQRLEWKNNLIKTADERFAMAPVKLDACRDATGGNDLSGRRVHVTGQFSGPSFYLMNKVRNDQAGLYVFTFLTLSDNSAILVNRGWIAKGGEAMIEAPASPVAFDAVIKSFPARKPPYVPQNEFDKNHQLSNYLYWLNGKALKSTQTDMHACDNSYLEIITPLSGFSGRQPAAVGGKASFPNNHFQYALTWFGLAVIVAAMTGIYISRS